MVPDGESGSGPQLGVAFDVFLGERVFKATRDLESSDLLEQFGKMIVGAPMVRSWWILNPRGATCSIARI